MKKIPTLYVLENLSDVRSSLNRSDKAFQLVLWRVGVLCLTTFVPHERVTSLRIYP